MRKRKREEMMRVPKRERKKATTFRLWWLNDFGHLTKKIFPK